MWHQGLRATVVGAVPQSQRKPHPKIRGKAGSLETAKIWSSMKFEKLHRVGALALQDSIDTRLLSAERRSQMARLRARLKDERAEMQARRAEIAEQRWRLNFMPLLRLVRRQRVIKLT